MIYDGFDFSPYLLVESIERPFLPKVDVSTDNVDGMNGSVLRSVRLDEGEVKVKVRMIRPYEEEYGLAGGFEKLRRELSGRLFRETPCKLVLEDAPDVYYMAMLSKDTMINDLVFTRTATLYFVCPDPVTFGMEHTRRSDGGLIHCNVGGNWKTAPVIEVSYEYSDAIVYVDGKPLRALGSISGEHPLTFDCVNHVTKKGEAPVMLSIFDDYPDWKPGNHTVECEHPFEVRWVERWL